MHFVRINHAHDLPNSYHNTGIGTTIYGQSAELHSTNSYDGRFSSSSCFAEVVPIDW